MVWRTLALVQFVQPDEANDLGYHSAPEEDHIDRNGVYVLKVLEFYPEISVSCLDYNFLLCSAE